MIDDRHLEYLLRPPDRVGIGALAGQKQRAEIGEIVFADELAVRILLLDGPERGGRSEQRCHAVLADHPPEGAGVRRADGLAFIDDRCAAMQQRRVDDVGVADYPADVGCRPEYLPGLTS